MSYLTIAKFLTLFNILFFSCKFQKNFRTSAPPLPASTDQEERVDNPFPPADPRPLGTGAGADIRRATCTVSAAPGESLTMAPILEGSIENMERALISLKNHLDGTLVLNPEALTELQKPIGENAQLLANDQSLVEMAFAIVRNYESSIGGLWQNPATQNGTIEIKPKGNNSPKTGQELEKPILALMQGIVDHAYTAENLIRFPQIFSGKKFETSSYFPGAAEPSPTPSCIMALIDGSQPAPMGIPVMYDDRTTLRPTGTYVPPGTLVTVKVPTTMVDNGFFLTVGAHINDLKDKPRINRLFRVSIRFPIYQSHMIVANPLGGGLYVEVPPLADAGLSKIEISNAIRSPLFSMKAFHMTTIEDWKDLERSHPGPWTDLESEKFMVQVPTSWITSLDDPQQTLESWDRAMDAISDVLGKPRKRPGKTVLFLQADVIARTTINAPGYPQSNEGHFNPNQTYKGNHSHFFLTGPQNAPPVLFHELGHAQLFSKFPGETEALVNFLYVAAMNIGFEVPIDKAFSMSLDKGQKEQISLDQAAMMWMVTENFRNGQPMDASGSSANEFRYQHRGFGKYVDIVKLFGWESLGEFWRQENEDFTNDITHPYPKGMRIFKLSKAIGFDIRPLIHVWGVHPKNEDDLQTALYTEGLNPSAKIYDRLVEYKNLVPADNQSFVTHADIVFPERKGGNMSYGGAFYAHWEQLYDSSHGDTAKRQIQNLLDRYFPQGRP